ncbi:MAG: hypothetical protein K9G38_00585 [Bacteroidales bacterium]|nr:hypothetical protein [Bacteroidales bacterium]
MGDGDIMKGADISVATACDSIMSYSSLYINRIAAEIFMGNDVYESRVSLYYLPDSLFVLSAVSAGFEMVRIGMNRDSTVYINRLDKLVYIFKESPEEQPPPVQFEDLEYLLNRPLLCDAIGKWEYRDKDILINRSLENIDKEIRYYDNTLKIKEFQFFQKKTGEYIVGEWKDGNVFVIYSNFIFDDFRIEAGKGNVQFDKKISVNLQVNQEKYDIRYL